MCSNIIGPSCTQGNQEHPKASFVKGQGERFSILAPWDVCMCGEFWMLCDVICFSMIGSLWCCVCGLLIVLKAQINLCHGCIILSMMWKWCDPYLFAIKHYEWNCCQIVLVIVMLNVLYVLWTMLWEVLDKERTQIVEK